jgi:hypothetical protein
MHLFDASLSGELFACRVVHYLLHRAPELRDGLLTAINRKITAVRLVGDQHFSCTREWSTSSSDGGSRGRVDILIEVDSAVVGVEVKLNASLNEDQPRKYVAEIGQHALQLAGLRRLPIAAVMVLLVPAFHANRLSLATLVENLERPVHQCVLTWDELFDEWRACRPSDPVMGFVLSELEHLVGLQTGRLANFRELLPLLQHPLATSTSGAHEELVKWLWPAFRSDLSPGRTRLISRRDPSGQSWVGYYFFGGSDPWGWYGFVDAATAGDDAEGPPVLLMGTTLSVRGLDPNVFRPISFAPNSFHEDASYWRIHIPQSWDRVDAWRERLAPMHAAVISQQP